MLEAMEEPVENARIEQCGKTQRWRSSPSLIRR